MTLRRLRRYVVRWRNRNADRRIYPAHDLRQMDCGPVEAYYRHHGEPCIISVPLRHCRWIGGTGLSYARDSLHPYIRTLVAYVAGQCDSYHNSSLKEYWANYQPANLSEMFDLNPHECHPLLQETPPTHDVLPWVGADWIDFLRSRLWKEHPGFQSGITEPYPRARSCGPKPDFYGEKRFSHLVGVYERIKKNSYRWHAPVELPYKNQHINIAVLVRGTDARYMVLAGQHRAAALSVLNHTSVLALCHVASHRSPAIIRREDVDEWPLVREGIFERAQALQIFDAVFTGGKRDHGWTLDSAPRHPEWNPISY